MTTQTAFSAVGPPVGLGAIYEQGRVCHIGHHPELEEQLLSFTGAVGESSPDRLDAATWAITDLIAHGLHRHADSGGPTVVPWSDHITDPTVVRWS